MSIRDELEAELAACRADPERDTTHLNLIADDFAQELPWNDEKDALENEVIEFIWRRNLAKIWHE